jgi:hypothetical protein
MTTAELEKLLALPAVQEARRNYEASKIYRGRGLKFDDLLRWYASYKRFKTVASHFKISEQTADYIYLRFFQEICGGMNGIQRRKMRQNLRWKKQLRSLAGTLPKDSPVGYVMARAKEACCKTDILPRIIGCSVGGRITARVLTLGINGYVCSVQCTHTYHGKIGISRNTHTQVKAHVIVAPARRAGECRRIVILPAEVIYNTRFKDNDFRQTYIAVTSGEKISCGYTDLCTRGYEDAWWVVGQLKPRAE